MATILIPAPLRPYTAKQDKLEITAATVGEALGALMEQYPDLRRQLCNTEGKLRSFVNVYVNDQDIRYLNREATPLTGSDTISIVPSIAGGDGRAPAHERRNPQPRQKDWKRDREPEIPASRAA